MDANTRRAINKTLDEWFEEKPERKTQKVEEFFNGKLRRRLPEEPPVFCQECGKLLKPYSFKFWLPAGKYKSQGFLWHNVFSAIKPDGEENGKPFIWAVPVYGYCNACIKIFDERFKAINKYLPPARGRRRRIKR